MNSRVKDKSYIVIQGWMSNQLGLKGNELIVYAIIYGFSQDGEQSFTGSLKYLADWTSSTKQGVMKVLKKLVENNLILKTEKYTNSIKFCEYKVNSMKQSSLGYETKFTGGMKQSLPNNIDYTIDNNIDNSCNSANDSEKPKKKKRDEGYSDDFLEFWKLYNMSINKPKSFTLWKKKNFSEEELKEVMKKVKLYVDNTEKRFRKHPERYIRDNCWNDEVIVKTNVNRYGKPEPKNISTAIKNTQPVDEWEEYNKMKRGNK